MGKSFFGGTTQQIVLGLGAALMFIMAIEASQLGFGGGFGFFGWNDNGGFGWHGASIVEEHGTTRVRVHEKGCKIRLEQSGEVALTADERDIASLAGGARFELEARGCGEKFELVATPGAGGAPVMAAKLGGKEVPWDDAARTRFHAAMQTIFESSGFDAEGRVERLYARGGAAAVLEAASRMRSDSGQRAFLQTLLAKPGLTVEETVQVWQLAGTALDSDYELAQMIQDSPAPHAADRGVQQAIVLALRSLSSDYELRRTLDVLLDRGAAGEILDELLAVASDKINSDYEQAEFLIRVADKLPASTPLPAHLYGALESIDSDHELRRSLDAFLERDSLSRAELGRLLEVATGRISSDYELAQLLIEVARLQKRAEPWPPALRQAIASIGSDHEQKRAREAFGEAFDNLDEAAPVTPEAPLAPETSAPN